MQGNNGCFMSDALGALYGFSSFRFGQAQERATSVTGSVRNPLSFQQASSNTASTSTPVTLNLSDNALSILSESPISDGVAALLESLDPEKNQARDAAINLIGPFFRAAQSGRALTGTEASQIGEAFLSVNAEAGFTTDPQSLSEQERSTLLANLATFDAVTSNAGGSQLSAQERQTLDTALNAVETQLGAQIPSEDLAILVRNSLENEKEDSPSLFDFSGTALAGLTGDGVTETVNSVTAINRETGDGADTDELSASRQVLLENLVSEFDSILQTAGSSLLLGDQLRRLGSITSLISTLLRSGSGSQVFAETTPASNTLSAFEELLGYQGEGNPLVIALR